MASKICRVSRMDRSNDPDAVLSWDSWRGKDNHGSYSNRRALRKISRRFEYLRSLFYCNFRRHDQPEDLLLGLLKQLVRGQPTIPDMVKNLQSSFNNHPKPPHLKRSQEFCTMSYLCILRSSLLSTLLMSSQYLNEKTFPLKVFDLEAATDASPVITFKIHPRYLSNVRKEDPYRDPR